MTSAQARRGDSVIRVPKTAELVASAIRRQIITGEAPAGSVLPAEAALMAQFAVSRPTLREAVRLLESENLVEVRRGPYGGALVRTPDANVAARYMGLVLQHSGVAISDVFDALVLVELPLARELAASASATQLARLREALETAEAALDDPNAYVAHDLGFHLLLADLVANETLRLLIHMLHHIIGLARREYMASADPARASSEARRVHRLHTEYVDLVTDGRPAAAVALWERHLGEVRRHYLASPAASTVLELFDLSVTERT